MKQARGPQHVGQPRRVGGRDLDEQPARSEPVERDDVGVDAVDADHRVVEDAGRHGCRGTGREPCARRRSDQQEHGPVGGDVAELDSLANQIVVEVCPQAGGHPGRGIEPQPVDCSGISLSLLSVAYRPRFSLAFLAWA